MNFIKKALVSALLLVLPLQGNLAMAQNTASLSELEANISQIFPEETAIDGLAYHSTWNEVGRKSMTQAYGIEVTYEARLDEDDSIDEELPTINLYALSFSSAETAQIQFDLWKKSSQFDTGRWTKLSEGSRFFTYLAEEGNDNDLVKSRSLEDDSLHMVSAYENLIFIANFYHPPGIYSHKNIVAYQEYLDDSDQVLSVLNDAIFYTREAVKFYGGESGAFSGPGNYDHYPSNASDSQRLDQSYPIPLNGTLSVELFLDETAEIGTIFTNSSEKGETTGQLRVTLDEKANVKLSMYAPNVESSCKETTGWHTLKSRRSLYLYEWESIKLRYGNSGLQIQFNDESTAECELSVPRSSGPFYLGDYPEDDVEESFIGYVRGITTSYSENEQGIHHDDLMGAFIFTDVTTTHPHAEAIAYMKENRWMVGYEDGSFKPDRAVNRVEILKVLLLGFDYSLSSSISLPFSDLTQGAWYVPYINTALEAGIISGNPDGSYDPEYSLNRASFLKILLATSGVDVSTLNVGELYPDVSKEDWFAPYVQYSKDNRLMDPNGYGYFEPARTVTRAELAETLWRLLH